MHHGLKLGCNDRKYKFLEKCSCCDKKIHKDMPRFTKSISFLYADKPKRIHLCARCIISMSDDIKQMDLDFKQMDMNLLIKIL